MNRLIFINSIRYLSTYFVTYTRCFFFFFFFFFLRFRLYLRCVSHQAGSSQSLHANGFVVIWIAHLPQPQKSNTHA
jgi:hypothetical protein